MQERALRTYVLRFLKAGKAVYQREFYATDARVACLIARAACRASEVAHDTTELWEGTRQIEWVPPRMHCPWPKTGRVTSSIERLL